MNFGLALFILIFTSIVLGYLFGSILWSIIISKKVYNIDIREYASKNPGTTNTARVLGKKAGIIVFILDIIKVLFPTFIVWAIYRFALNDYLITNSIFKWGNFIYFSGFFAIIGHIFPIYYKFRGGKGVACSIAFFFTLSIFIGLIFLITLLIVLVISKYMSLGAVISTCVATLFVLIPFINHFYLVDENILHIQQSLSQHTINASFIFLLCVINSILVTIKHKQNFIRIKNKCENKVRMFTKKTKTV